MWWIEVDVGFPVVAFLKGAKFNGSHPGNLCLSAACMQYYVRCHTF